jgi:PAS domain S-box-containing protein
MKINTGYTSEITLSEMLIESSIDAIIAIDNARNVIAWNSAASAIYNKHSSGVLGKPIHKILPSIEKDEEITRAISHAENGFKSFVPASKEFEHRLHVETHIIPLKNGKCVTGVMLLVHDVSHRIKAEETLQYLNNELQDRIRQLQATSRELAYLTYVATHKIRGPIRNIYTAIEGLIKTEAASLSNSGRASFRRMQSSLNRMNLLLDDIITLTEINIVEKPRSMIKIEEVVEEILKSLEQKIAETRVVVNIGELCEIRAHKSQLVLLLHHMVYNIIKFNQSEIPVISISCHKKNIKKDEFKDIKGGDYYMLTIHHNGAALDNQATDTTAESFEKLNENSYKGYSMVLPIATKIMEVHGGFLTIENNTDKESSLKCFFPA